jgi:hypothetical protein
MQINFIWIFGGFLLLELYIYQGIKHLLANYSYRLLYTSITFIIYSILIYFILNLNEKNFSTFFSLAMIFLIPKILGGIILFIDDFIRLVQYFLKYFIPKDSHFPERRKFMSVLAIGSTAILAGLVIDGIIWGKFRHRVRKIKLNFPNLPNSFKGYKIIQISDVHSGSFPNPQKLQHAINLINQQNPDLVLFTGDIVNNYAEEFKPFIQLFSQIKAKDGKFSVLGNHDYGLYGTWETPQEQMQNVPSLINYQKESGFEMLRNEHKIIEKNGEKIYLVGVENWGEPPFPQFGNLDKATKGIPTEMVKILMSHDPTHFDAIVKTHPSNIQLTLSGHTHGMQFGIDLGNIKWSPAQYHYKKWADLYQSMDKYLYVNRGFGVIGFNGRVGIYPEITLIELI